MKQFQIINAVHFFYWRYLFCIKFGIIGPRNASFQLLFRKIRQEFAHHYISHFLITHLRQLGIVDIQSRNLSRHK